MEENKPVEERVEVAITAYLPFRDYQDVQNFITYAADVWARYPKRTVSIVHPNLPLGPDELAKAHRLDLDPANIERELVLAWKYLQRVRKARREGRPSQIKASNVRTCALCEQSWPSFAHYLTSPNAPKHLRCKGCFKRVPVGLDIQELPERKAQPYTSLGVGPTLTTSALSTINTTQLCEATDCPVHGQPHPIGLFSHSRCRAPRSWDLALTANSAIDEAFWGGNDLVPTNVMTWARTIAREEQMWRQGGQKAVSNLYEIHSKASIDRMRKDVRAFRAYHCHYEPIGRTQQKDLLPEHLRVYRSRLSVDRFLSVLQKVNVEDLSANEKKCKLCRGILEQDLTLAGEREVGLRLPCSHIVGAECLGLLFLSRLEGGWGQKKCPTCRLEVYDEDAQENAVASGLKFGYQFISRQAAKFDHDPKMLFDDDPKVGHEF